MKKFKKFAIVTLASVAVLAFVLALAVGASPLAQEAPTPTPIPTATPSVAPTPVKVIAFSGYSDCRFSVKGPGTLHVGFKGGTKGTVTRIGGGETVVAEVTGLKVGSWTYQDIALAEPSATFLIEIDAPGDWYYVRLPADPDAPMTWDSASQPKGDSGQRLFRLSACGG